MVKRKREPDDDDSETGDATAPSDSELNQTFITPTYNLTSTTELPPGGVKIFKGAAITNMILPRASINSVLLNSAREMDSIPLVMDYKHFDGTVIPELVVPTNELILAISRVSTDLSIPQGDGFQDAYEMVMNAVFSQNTNNIFVMQIISAVMLHVQFHSKLMNGAAVSLVENIESRFRRSVETLSYRLEENVGSIDCPFTAIIVHGPGNLVLKRTEGEVPASDAFEGGDFSKNINVGEARRSGTTQTRTLPSTPQQSIFADEQTRKEQTNKIRRDIEARKIPKKGVSFEDTAGKPVKSVSGVDPPRKYFEAWVHSKRDAAEERERTRREIPKGTNRESRREEGEAYVANAHNISAASTSGATDVIRGFAKKQLGKRADEASAQLRALDKTSVQLTKTISHK